MTHRIFACTSRRAGFALCLSILLPACAQTSIVADAPATPASLQGTAWQLAVAADAPIPRLQFTNAAEVAGSSGCNSFSGPLAMTGDEVRMGPLASTKRMCLGQPQETEKRFMNALEQTRKLVLKANRLQLLNAQGQLLLTLDAAAFKSP
jgi:heat shock protein HslJ